MADLLHFDGQASSGGQNDLSLGSFSLPSPSHATELGPRQRDGSLTESKPEVSNPKPPKFVQKRTFERLRSRSKGAENDENTSQNIISGPQARHYYKEVQFNPTQNVSSRAKLENMKKFSLPELALEKKRS